MQSIEKNIEAIEKDGKEFIQKLYVEDLKIVMSQVFEEESKSHLYIIVDTGKIGGKYLIGFERYGLASTYKFMGLFPIHSEDENVFETKLYELISPDIIEPRVKHIFIMLKKAVDTKNAYMKQVILSLLFRNDGKILSDENIGNLNIDALTSLINCIKKQNSEYNIFDQSKLAFIVEEAKKLSSELRSTKTNNTSGVDKENKYKYYKFLKELKNSLQVN